MKRERLFAPPEAISEATKTGLLLIVPIVLVQIVGAIIEWCRYRLHR